MNPVPTSAPLDFSEMQRFPRTRTINSNPVRVFPLIVNGKQIEFRDSLDLVQGLVWWLEDVAARGGRRVIFERVETDPVTQGSKMDEHGTGVTYYEDVYMRANGKHMHAHRRYRNADEQTISNIVSRGGNSLPEDLYLKKGMHWCTPEEFVAFQAQSELNAALHSTAKRDADPKRDIAKLADLMAEALDKNKRPSGNVRDAMAAAAADDRAADEASKKMQPTSPLKGK